MKQTDRNSKRRGLTLMLAFLFVFTVAWMNAMQEAHAAVDSVTLAVGKSDYYGDGGMMTHVRWVTHVNEEAVDLDVVPGAKRSYAYCVEPNMATPAAGVYKVSVIDDDGSGKNAKMRKLIYYLPGSYGYKKVTKKKWFDGKDVDASDYAIGHVALSWLYDNRSEENHAWAGAGSAIQKLVKKMISDLDDLADPPDDYEVFWIKSSSHQDTFGAFYSTEYGKIKIHKVSALPEITDGNPCYSLNGAEYSMYTDSDCKEKALTSDDKPAVLHLNEEGDSETLELETGIYYLKETEAPRGYALDSEPHSVEIGKDKTTTYSARDIPKNDQVDLLIQKVDRETSINRPQGSASLKDAEYKVSYFSELPKNGMTEDALEAAVADREPAKINGSDAVWVLRTDEDGRIYLSDPEKYLVSGPEFFTDSSGKPCFPIGVIRIEETKAPQGYERNVHVWYLAVTEAGKEESMTTLKVLDGRSPAEEQVIRGDICLTKTGEDCGKMAGIPFRFTSVTTGESRVMVTDSEGFLSSASDYASHLSYRTEPEENKDADAAKEADPESTIGSTISEGNADGEGPGTDTESPAADTDSGSDGSDSGGGNVISDAVSADDKTNEVSEKDNSSDADGAANADGGSDAGESRKGIWFNGYNDEETGAKPDDSLGAFPYDTYIMEELRCEANEGYDLVSDKITIAEPNVTVDLGTYNDLRIPDPKLETTATDKESETHNAAATDSMVISDLIEYEGVRPGKNYRIEGVLVDKSTGKTLRDDDGVEIRGAAEFYASEPDGIETVEFHFSGKKLNGKDAVAYEYLKLDGETIASHADIKSASQTVKIRSKKTPPPEKDKPPKKNPPKTGDNKIVMLYGLTAAAAALEILVLTMKRRNDRLN